MKASFFAELKRRNVYQVAAVYAVVGWLVIQVANTVLPTFHAPEWILQTLVVLFALGFAVAVAVAWVFRLTPQGLQRTEDTNRQPQEPLAPRAWIYIVVVAGLLSIGLFLLGRYSASSTNSTSPGASAITNKSIAVLPFENLSDDKSNAYFAEGIQDEILTGLAKIADLKVISRTSTEKYKSAPNNLREIGQELGVANILEGSVQKIGNAVHVNVQLIRAANDEHIWAESYNRKLDDVFAVEGEVATTIAEQLNVKLSGSEQKALANKPTQNQAAYDAYLRGVALENSSVNAENERDAAAAFSKRLGSIHSSREPGPAWRWLVVFFTSTDWIPARRSRRRRIRRSPFSRIQARLGLPRPFTAIGSYGTSPPRWRHIAKR